MQIRAAKVKFKYIAFDLSVAHVVYVEMKNMKLRFHFPFCTGLLSIQIKIFINSTQLYHLRNFTLLKSFFFSTHIIESHKLLPEKEKKSLFDSSKCMIHTQKKDHNDRRQLHLENQVIFEISLLRAINKNKNLSLICR